ncbi:putative gelsolin repeat protein [Aspergillus ibericus CBS 121593]|uniref:DUF4045 domain-containing protein n=1 Tax=Aspergillus ibericus CBS 121593 TaxID=1448316 RepID=A0A395HBF7_9EURO|nr:hypothetical protein BO80DRAFT_498952 [Aspergillus ibericus CBS 121593]RAL05247.1 hypothetical protein BO80DRAFT_498952 [Aspergillus ibericus CBS 121593]
MKRSDSVSKRWSAQLPSGLNRGNPFASNRNSYAAPSGGDAFSTTPSYRLSREGSSLSPSRPSSSHRPGSSHRPSSSHSEATVVHPPKDYERPATPPVPGSNITRLDEGARRPSLSLHTRSTSTIERSADSGSLPPTSPSVSRTMDPKRWSPTKATWLESALNRDESPRHKRQPSQQSPWAKDRQSRGSVDLGRTASFKEVTPVGLMRTTAPGTHSKTSSITGIPDLFSSQDAGKAKEGEPEPIQENADPKDLDLPPAETPAEKSTEVVPSRESSPTKTVVEPENKEDDAAKPKLTPSALSPITKTTSDAPLASPRDPLLNRPKPLSPVIDFRANLRRREVVKDEAPKAEPEFKNVFGRLKKAESSSYVPPDQLRENILKGKASLSASSGPKKSQKVDELKDSILKQKEAIKAGGGSLRRNTAGENDAPMKFIPEAIAMRNNLTKSSSIKSNLSAADTSSPRSPLSPREPDTPKSAHGPQLSSPLFSAGDRIEEPQISPAIAESQKPDVDEKQTEIAGPELTNDVKEDEQEITDEGNVNAEEESKEEGINPVRSLPPGDSMQATSAPVVTESPAAKSKLAGRLNPALAGLLSRGPPAAMDLSMRAPSTNGAVGSSLGVEEPQAAALTHLTKGRARGPKRRLPQGTTPEGTNSLFDENNFVPESPPTPLDAQRPEPMYLESGEESDASEFSAPLDAEEPETVESQREKEKDAPEPTAPVDEEKPEAAMQVMSRVTSPVCEGNPGAPELSAHMDKEEPESEPASPVRKDIYTPEPLALVDEEKPEARSPALEENIHILEPSVYVDEERLEITSPAYERNTDAPEPLAPMYKDEEESEPASPVHEENFDFPQPLSSMHKKGPEVTSPVREDTADILQPSIYVDEDRFEALNPVREEIADTLQPSVYAEEGQFEASSPVYKETFETLELPVPVHEELESASPARAGTINATEPSDLVNKKEPEVMSSLPEIKDTVPRSPSVFSDAQGPESLSSALEEDDDDDDAFESTLDAKEAEATSPIAEVHVPEMKVSEAYETPLKSPSIPDTQRPESVHSSSEERSRVPEPLALEAEATSLIPKVQTPEIKETAPKALSISSDTQRPESLYSASEDSDVPVSPVLEAVQAEARNLIPEALTSEGTISEVNKTALKSPSVYSGTQRPESMYSSSDESDAPESPVLGAEKDEGTGSIPELQVSEVKISKVDKVPPKPLSISSETQRPGSMYSSSEESEAPESPVLGAQGAEKPSTAYPFARVQLSEATISQVDEAALQPLSTSSNATRPESMYSSDESEAPESPVLGAQEAEKPGTTYPIPEVQLSETRISTVDETVIRPLSITSEAERPEFMYSSSEESDALESPVLGAQGAEKFGTTYPIPEAQLPEAKISKVDETVIQPLSITSEAERPESAYSSSEESDAPESPVLGAKKGEVKSSIPEVKISETDDKFSEFRLSLPDVPAPTHSVPDENNDAVITPALDAKENENTSSIPEVIVAEVDGTVPESPSVFSDVQRPASIHSVSEEHDDKAVESLALEAEKVKATSSLPEVTTPEVNGAVPESSSLPPATQAPAPAHLVPEENSNKAVESSETEADKIEATSSVSEITVADMNHTTPGLPSVFSDVQRPASTHSITDENDNDTLRSPSLDTGDSKALFSVSEGNGAGPTSPASSLYARRPASTHSVPEGNDDDTLKSLSLDDKEPKALFSASEANEAAPKSPASSLNARRPVSTHSVLNENDNDSQKPPSLDDEEPKALFSASEANEAAPKSPASSLKTRGPVSPIGSPGGVSSGWPLPDTQIKPNVEPKSSPSQHDSPVANKPTEFKRSVHRLIEREAVQKPDDVSSKPSTASAKAASHSSSPSWENASAYFKSLRSSFSAKPPLPPKTAPLPSTPMANQTRSSPIHFSSPSPSPLRGSFKENQSHAPPTQQRSASSLFSTIGSRSSSPRDKALPSPPVPPKGSRASVDRFSSRSSTSLVPQADESWEAISDFFKTFPKSSDRVNIDTQLMLADRSDNTKIRTLKRQLWEITGDGKKQDLPVNQEYILYEGSMYLCMHLFEADGTVRSEVHLWCGDDVPDAAVDDAQPFSRKVAKDNGSKLEIIKQGKEPARFIQALGGILITRRGSSSRSSSSAIFMLCGRKHLGQMVFDEVNFSPSSLCSGYPFVISAMFGKLFLWKGKGSSAEEIGAARLIGMDLGLTGEFEEVAEGEEPASFFEDFIQYERKTSNDSINYWQLKPNLERYRSRLFRIDHELGQRSGFWMRSPSPVIRPNDTVQEVEPFCQKDITPKGIYVLDTFFEIYVIVGEQASNRPAEFASAVVLAHEYGILAASLQDRPFIPKSFVSLGGVPESCSSAFRKWNPNSPSQCLPQVFPLNAAIESIRSP